MLAAEAYWKSAHDAGLLIRILDKGVRSPDKTVRIAAIEVIGRVIEKVPAVTTIAVSALHDKDHDVRSAAAFILKNLDAETAQHKAPGSDLEKKAKDDAAGDQKRDD